MALSVYIRLLALTTFLVPLFCVSAQAPPQTPPQQSSLFAQSAVEILRRDFPRTGSSYLLLDARSGTVLAQRWSDPEKPIPLGSLVKPFTALAYASSHEFRYPHYECRGTASRCWQARPHGNLDFVSAISLSCNAYFRRMAEAVSADEIQPITLEFGFEPPDDHFESAALAGLGTQWRISPLRMARAYLELYRRKEQPGVLEILQGMKESSVRGTGAGVGRQLEHTAALVKTGTAPCTHTPWAPADGFTIVMFPADDPQILLMVREHSVTGATAAATAGILLREIEE